MKKSFADQCLDLAAAATPGPWHKVEDEYGLRIPEVEAECGGCISWLKPSYDKDGEFIAASREMVPELARRLRIALETISMLLENDECRQDQDCDHCLALQVIDDLEAMPEDEK